MPSGEGKKMMIDNLKSLKDEYLTKGGEDVEFISKVNDLENLLLYNRKVDKPDHRKMAPGVNQSNEIQVT